MSSFIPSGVPSTYSPHLMFNPRIFDIATVTGIIGAVIALAGCLIAWISYKRSQQIKALDLRLELRKQASSVRDAIDGLPALLERARASRSRVSAAMGRGPQSGANLIWKAKLENDLKTVRDLGCELPDPKETFQRLKPRKLEDKLVEVHALAAKVAQLRNKYEMALASDDKDRDHIRANAHRRFDS